MNTTTKPLRYWGKTTLVTLFMLCVNTSQKSQHHIQSRSKSHNGPRLLPTVSMKFLLCCLTSFLFRKNSPPMESWKMFSSKYTLSSRFKICIRLSFTFDHKISDKAVSFPVHCVSTDSFKKSITQSSRSSPVSTRPSYKTSMRSTFSSNKK